MKQFLFECKKIMKKRTSWISVILSFAAVIGLTWFHFSTTESIRNGIISKQQNMLNDYQSYLDEAEVEKAKAEEQEDAEKTEEMAALIERFKESISSREKWLEQYTIGDWHPIYQEQLEDLVLYMSDYGSIYIEEQPIPHFTLKASLKEKEWLDEKGLAPFVQNTTYTSFHPTIYDEFTGRALTEWKKITARYGSTGLEFLYGAIPYFYIPILILVGCFIFGNAISSEIGKKHRGLHFHFVQPVSKSNVLFAKYVGGLFFTILFVSLLIAAPLIGGLMDNGIGDLSFPVLIYEGSEPNPYDSKYNALDPMTDELHFIPMSQFIGQVLLLGAILTFFLYSLYFFLSIGFKSPAVTVLATSGLIVIGLKLLPSSTFNPFIYADIQRVVNGEMATLTFNPAIGLQNGIIALAMSGCVLLLIGFVAFNLKARRLIS